MYHMFLARFRKPTGSFFVTNTMSFSKQLNLYFYFVKLNRVSGSWLFSQSYFLWAQPERIKKRLKYQNQLFKHLQQRIRSLAYNDYDNCPFQDTNKSLKRKFLVMNFPKINRRRWSTIIPTWDCDSFPFKKLSISAFPFLLIKSKCKFN